MAYHSYQELPFLSFNGPETLFSNNSSVNSAPKPVEIPSNLGGGSATGLLTGPPIHGDPNWKPSPTNVMGPFDYMQPGYGAGNMPSGDDRQAYEDAMADTYANVVINEQGDTGYTGQGSQSMAGIGRPSNTNTNPASGAVGGGGGGGYSGPAPVPQVPLSQDISQRQQTGNIYAPDLSAYNDSSLFNYTGPGGLDEYTYGQNLPTDGAGYNIWGSPTDVANPYYEGQYKPLPVGPADGAIGMSPVTMPDGVPDTNKNQPSQPELPNFGHDYSSDPAYAGIDMSGYNPGGAHTMDVVPYTLNGMELSGSSSQLSELENYLNSTGQGHFLTRGWAGSDSNPTSKLLSYPSQGSGTGGGGTGPDGKDLTYQETLDYFGLNKYKQSTTFPSPGETVPDKDYQDMLDKALAGTMDNQLENQLDSSKPSPIMMDEQQNYEYDPYKGEAALNKDVKKIQLPDQDFLSDDMDLSFDPNLDFDSSKDPNNLESNYQYEDLLARRVGAGMADSLEALKAKGQKLQDMYDAQEAIQNKDNLFNEHFDRNQAEYTPKLSDVTNATPMQLAGSSSTLSGEKLNTRHPAYQAQLDRVANESENIFQNQDVDADAYQRALEKERYQTQINNPTADFSGTMKNYGSGFKSHEPQSKLSDVSSATPMQLAGSGSTLSGEQLNTRHPAYQAMLDRQANEAENIFQNQGAESDAYQRALEKDRYQTQINNPTADFSGTMKNYGSGFKSHEPQAKLSDVSSATPMQLAGSSTLSGDKLNTRHPAYQAQLDRETNQAENLFQNQDTGFPAEPRRGSFAGSSANQVEARNTNIFDDNRADSIFAKGPSQAATEIKSVFDEQQNYEVPASEMSPGEVGLVNGLLEGMETIYGGAFSVDGSGTDRNVTVTETAAWEKYYDYKNAGIEALNKGDIDVKAFNELKGKAGSDTVMDHFVDTDKNPKINNFMSNTANLLYQTMDTIVGDDTIKDGIVDYYQQKKGVNSDKPLGTVVEEIAKAKEATQQRKEVQENIFTPGPMKFHAVTKPKPKKVVVKPTPKATIKRSTQKNVISKPKPKPGGRAGAGATSKAYKKFASNYGGRYGL